MLIIIIMIIINLFMLVEGDGIYFVLSSTLFRLVNYEF